MSNFEFTFGPGGGPRREEDDPFRLLVIGDFGAAATRTGGLADRPVTAVDVDNFEQFMTRLAPTVAGPDGETITLQSLDDFHPDRLYDRLAAFRVLRELRGRLLDAGTFAAAAAELKTHPEPNTPGGASAPGVEPASEFGRLLGGEPPGPAEAGVRPAAVSAVQRLIHDLVAPHIVPATDPQQPQLVAAVDDGIAGAMRGVLHDRAFQRLEARWRGLEMLVSRLETGPELSIHVLDATAEEIVRDGEAARRDASSSALHTRLVDRGARAPGGEPWSAIIADIRVTPEMLDAVAGLGAIAAGAGGPLLAAADPALLGCADVEALAALTTPGEPDASWATLRRSPVASWIGLALPGLLMRVPYGPRTEPIDRFQFEELPGGMPHAGYLWGNPAFGVGLLLGSSFQASGWSMSPGDETLIDDLPAHAFVNHDGATVLKPVAEVPLGERVAGAMLAAGLMPMLSHRNGNIAQIARFQSIADPPSALAGSWA